MDKIMEKLNKLSLPAVILIASFILGGFYYAGQVNKQRSIERQQQITIEQEKQDQLAKELKAQLKELKEQQAKEEAEQALNTCIATAESNYFSRWHKECKAQGKLTNRCIDINELSFDEYLKKYGLTVEQYAKERNLTIPTPPKVGETISEEEFLKLPDNSAFLDYMKRASDECSCRLLTSTADRLDESLENDKAECIKRYPPK